jgi:hypothetical protein
LINEKKDEVRFYLVPVEPRGSLARTATRKVAFSVSGAAAATPSERLARQKMD